MDVNDDEEDDLPKYQLSNNDDEENDETKDPIDTDKPYYIATTQIETALTSPIAALPIVVTTSTFLQVLKYLLVYHQFMYQGKHHQCQLTTSLLVLRLMVNIIGSLCVEKFKFDPCNSFCSKG